MKSCDECECFKEIASKFCIVKWKIKKHNMKGYKEHFNDAVFWKNLMLDFDINCPDFIQHVYQKDPYG